MRNQVFTLFLLLAVLFGAIGQAADVETITHGEQVDIKHHLVPGKYVLFDFYADWCGPCRGLAPILARLASQQSESLVLRKVDIKDWRSPVARQYSISSIPHLKLYGPEGHLIAEGGAGQVLHNLEDRLGKGTVDEAGGSAASSSMMPFLIFIGLLGIVAYLLFFKKKPASVPGSREPVPHRFATLMENSSPSDATWFVMIQGSLDGPFTVDDLMDLKKRKVIMPDAKIRRRGDAQWQSLTDLD